MQSFRKSTLKTVVSPHTNNKNWTRVNPEPVLMDQRVSMMCGLQGYVQGKYDSQNPHRDKFILVYVNDIGRQSMIEEKSPRFPVGTVIVKEKLPTKDSRDPELLTVMHKREAGYDPQNAIGST
jgi:hypothetical protein